MKVATFLVLLPFFTAVVLALVPSWRLGGRINAGSATLQFLLACALPWRLGASGPMLLVDGLAAHLVLLTAFVAMTTSWFSLAYVRVEIARRRLDRRRLRTYHVAYQCFVGGMLLALLSNNLGVTWVAIETATIAFLVMVAFIVFGVFFFRIRERFESLDLHELELVSETEQ